MKLLIEIPGDLEPLERGRRFDIPLIEFLEPIGGDILDSGTFIKDGQVKSCHILIIVPNESVISQIVAILEQGAATAGTTLSLCGPTWPFELLWISEENKTN